MFSHTARPLSPGPLEAPSPTGAEPPVLDPEEGSVVSVVPDHSRSERCTLAEYPETSVAPISLADESRPARHGGAHPRDRWLAATMELQLRRHHVEGP